MAGLSVAGKKRPGGWAALGLVVVLAAGMACGLCRYTRPLASGAEPSAALAAARLLTASGDVAYRTVSSLETTGGFWTAGAAGGDTVYPVCPPGYSVALAGVRDFLGAGAEFWLNVLLYFLAAPLLYALARRFLPPFYAALAALLLSSSPVLFVNAQVKNAQTLGLVLTLLAGLALAGTSARADGRGRVGRLPVWWAAVCGLLLGLKVTVGYASLPLLILPPVFWLTARSWQRGKKKLILLAVYALGAALPLAALGVYHARAFGAPWRTAYDFFAPAQNAFSLGYFRTTSWVYTPALFTYGLGAAAGLAALCLFWRPGGREFTWRFWQAWLLPLFILCHFYYWLPQENLPLTLGMLLDLFPAALLLGVRALWRAARGGGWRWRIAIAAGVLLQALWAVKFTVPAAEANYRYESQAQGQAEFLRAHVPAGAVVVFADGTGTDRGRIVCSEALFGLKGIRLFSSGLLALNGIPEKMKERLLGGADAEALRALEEKALSLRREFTGKVLSASARAGRPMYYFGTAETAPAFRAANAGQFRFGAEIRIKPQTPDYLWRPLGKRGHNLETPKIAEQPDWVLYPLALAREEKP